MSKNRKRVLQVGAKSEAIRTKFKIGGRKSNKGMEQTSASELKGILGSVRKRDLNKLVQVLRNRGIKIA